MMISATIRREISRRQIKAGIAAMSGWIERHKVPQYELNKLANLFIPSMARQDMMKIMRTQKAVMPLVTKEAKARFLFLEDLMERMDKVPETRKEMAARIINQAGSLIDPKKTAKSERRVAKMMMLMRAQASWTPAKTYLMRI